MASVYVFPSSGELRLRGGDRVRFLQGMLTADVAKLAPGEGCPAAMLTPKGKLIGAMLVLCSDGFLDIVLDAGARTAVHASLEHHLIADDVVIEDRSAQLATIVLFGEDAAALIAGALGTAPSVDWSFVVEDELRVMRARELATPSFHITLPAARLAETLDWLSELGAATVDEDTWEVLRVEAGTPRWGLDMDGERMPVEARLDDALSHTKGCYVGQETVVRLRDQGKANWRLMGLRLEGKEPALAGSRLVTAERPDAGTVTSSVVSPRFGVIALAYVHRSAMAPGTIVKVVEHGRERSATVSELPFA